MMTHYYGDGCDAEHGRTQDVREMDAQEYALSGLETRDQQDAAAEAEAADMEDSGLEGNQLPTCRYCHKPKQPHILKYHEATCDERATGDSDGSLIEEEFNRGTREEWHKDNGEFRPTNDSPEPGHRSFHLRGTE